MEPLCSGEMSGELVLVPVCLVDTHAFSKEYRPKRATVQLYNLCRKMTISLGKEEATEVPGLVLLSCGIN